MLGGGPRRGLAVVGDVIGDLDKWGAVRNNTQTKAFAISLTPNTHVSTKKNSKIRKKSKHMVFYSMYWNFLPFRIPFCFQILKVDIF